MEQGSQSSCGRRVGAYALVLTRLAQMRCVVVGGGAVAERKVGELIAGGARPIVISPALTVQMQAWADHDDLEHTARVYQPDDVQDANIVIAATNDRAVNARIASAAPAGCLVNIADNAGVGNFHTVATVRRGDLLLAVSTGGTSPTLTAQIRRELDTRYGPEYADLTSLFGRWRGRVNQTLSNAARHEFWTRLRHHSGANHEASLEAQALELFETLHAAAPQRDA